jgi:flagellar biosynthesis protein FlhA
LVLAILSGFVAYFAQRELNAGETEAAAVAEAAEVKTEEKPEDYLHLDPLEITLGYGLIPLVDSAQGGDLLDRITMLRKSTALELGVVIPPIRIRDDITFSPNQYAIKIRGVRVAGAELQPRHLMAMDPGYVEGEVEGTNTIEPAFGLPAKWIAESAREQAELLGYTVVEPPDVLATHLTEVLKSHAHEILTRQDTQSLIDRVKESSPTVVEELVPDLLNVGGVQKVLEHLLQEQVPVLDMQTILETLADYANLTKDPEILTEYVRTALARTICQKYLNDEGNIPVLTVDPQLEQQIANAMQSTPGGIKVVLSHDVTNRLLERLAESIDGMVNNNQQPVVLTAPNVRPALRRLTETTFPSLAVLSYNEIVPGVDVYSVGMVSLDAVPA